jgi:site-specific DNA-methyltransferase (adenine-specific)
MSDYQLIEGDCLDILPTLPDKSVDAIITDIPYGTTACKWDVIIPLDRMWEQVKRLCKGAFVTTASQPFTSVLIMSNLDWFKYTWEWDKAISGNPFLATHQPLKVHEDIAVFSQNGHTYNPQMRRGKLRKKGGGYSKIWDTQLTSKISEDYYPTSILDFSNADRKVEHPTQKPVALYEYLIKTYTNPGDTVLDFCMGSGTTGVAAVRTGRNFIGIEKESNYFEIAQRRITEVQQMELVA